MATDYRQIGAFPISALRTDDPNRAVKDAAGLWTSFGVPVYVWDINGGVRSFRDWNAGRDGRGGGSPKAIFERLNGDGGIVFAIHLHLHMKSPNVMQALLTGAMVWGNSETLTRLVIVVPSAYQFPQEVGRYIHAIDFSLPDKDMLAGTIRANAAANGIEISEDEIDHLAETSLGLTTYELGNAVALSIALKREIDPKIVWDEKRRVIEGNGVLKLINPQFGFADIGGLDNAKKFMKQTAGHPLSKGVLLLGVPGTGKTMIAGALAKEINWPLISLNFSGVYGSLVGESEAKIRGALQILDAIGSAVLLVDEIEKGLAGSQSSGKTDSGVASRVFETFLRWLNDRTTPIYVIATSNGIQNLPPELYRAGRWDAILFVDIPTPQERDEIVKIAARRYNVPVEPRPDDHGWTGAEIDTAYRIASMMNVTAKEAAQYVTPLYRVAEEEISNLRGWAQGRTVPASSSVFEADGVADDGVRRVTAWAA